MPDTFGSVRRTIKYVGKSDRGVSFKCQNYGTTVKLHAVERVGIRFVLVFFLCRAALRHIISLEPTNSQAFGQSQARTVSCVGETTLE